MSELIEIHTERIIDRLELQGSAYSFSYHQSIDDISAIWNDIAINEHFAQATYLKVLEDDAPDHFKSIYVIIWKGEQAIGAILLQHLILKLSSALRYENYAKTRNRFVIGLQKLRQWIVSKFQFRLLTVGNLYLTGEYGFFFNDVTVSYDRQVSLVYDIVTQLKGVLRSTPNKFSAILYKDFFDEHRFRESPRLGLHPFQIDPNMILNLDESWMSFEDYLMAMRSKYRIRMKNAIKKFHPVTKKVLSSQDLDQYKSKMYELYCDILAGSGFVLIKGQEEYFKILKERFDNELQVVGYFLEGEMVAFYTWILDGDKMDSHFIGVSSQYNLKHQLYLNILLDLVRDAIDNRAKQLLYYRTALEIKSSIGAEPYEMMCYIKHNNPILTKLIPIVFKYFVPEQDWAQRHPFKKPAS